MIQPKQPGQHRHPRWLALCVVVLAMSAATGCVRRRLTVRSNPPGAVVHVDNQKIGTTPCAVDYVYYGTREIRLSLPGYETLTVNQPLPAPWYELPGVDFVSENLVPARIEDARTVSFNLQRQRLEPAEQIIARGEGLRSQMTPTGMAPVTPASATVDPFGGYVPQAQPLDPPPIIRAQPPANAPSVAPLSTKPPATTPPATLPPATLPPAGTPTPAPGLPDTFRY